MKSFEILHFLTSGGYFIATMLFFYGVGLKKEKIRGLASTVALCAFALHTIDLILPLRQGFSPLLQGNFYVSFITWILLGLWFVLWRKMHTRFLGIIILPLALILFVSSLALSTIHIAMPQQWTALFFGLHIGSLTLTLALSTLGFAAGLIWLFLNKKLKTKTALPTLDTSMPSLLIFDTINHWIILLGFPLYTLGIFSSYFWYWIDQEKHFTWDIMKLSALAVWFFFAFTFHQRLVLDWKGRKPALLAIWLFLLMAISLAHHTISFNRNL